jgi:hypothetical protein
MTAPVRSAERTLECLVGLAQFVRCFTTVERRGARVASFRVRYHDGGSEVVQAAGYAERGGFHDFYVWMGDTEIVTTRITSEHITVIEALDAK